MIISRDSKQGIAGFKKATGYDLPIVEDQTGTIAQKFNATWVPRAYQVSPDGILLWIQHEDNITPELIAIHLWNKPQLTENKSAKDKTP